MIDRPKEDKHHAEQSTKSPEASRAGTPNPDLLYELPASFVRTSLMVDSSKYTLLKLLAAFRMEEIRQCLDEALLHFINQNEGEIKKAIKWQENNEKRRKKRG